jgi:dihydroorotate dehydrogenase
MIDLSTTFTGLRLANPFLLSSAPPTESESNILRAFEAGWGGVVTKTIGLHPVVNVVGPKTKFLRADVDSSHLSMKKRAGAALHSSWNWELISDKTLDWWVPRLGRIKHAFPDRVLVASIMAGSGNDTELRHWQELAKACQEQGCDALELNLSCPHMDRPDMGSNVGKDTEQASIVTRVVKEVATVPVWAKLTPSTTDIVIEARGAFLGGADAISSSNTFTSLPLIDPDTLDFEIQVDGLVSTGGLGGPAILPLSLAKMSQLTQAFPDNSFSGIGGVSTFEHALNYFLLGCGTVQVCTAAMLDHAVGPNVIRALNDGLEAFLEKHADKGWKSMADFVAIASSRSRRSGGRTNATTAAATTPKATPSPRRREPRTASSGRSSVGGRHRARGRFIVQRDRRTPRPRRP